MDNEKTLLIKDIQNLLNSYGDNNGTYINPELLEFMDKDTLIGIIDSLLTQKENTQQDNQEWLEQFKKIQ